MALVQKTQRTRTHLHIPQFIIEQFKVPPKRILHRAHPTRFLLLLLNSIVVVNVSFVVILVNSGQVLSCRWSVSVGFLKLL